MNTTSSCLFIPLFFPFTTVKRGIIPFEVGPFPIVFHSTLRCLTERREEERRKESSLSLSLLFSRAVLTSALEVNFETQSSSEADEGLARRIE